MAAGLRVLARVGLVYGVWRVFLWLYPLTNQAGNLLWGPAFGAFILGLLSVAFLATAWLRS